MTAVFLKGSVLQFLKIFQTLQYGHKEILLDMRRYQVIKSFLSFGQCYELSLYFLQG
jgi:hypothetical protein